MTWGAPQCAETRQVVDKSRTVVGGERSGLERSSLAAASRLTALGHLS